MAEQSSSSIEKKRIRDRRAQQKLRDRKDCQMKALAQQVEYCRRHHDSTESHSTTVDTHTYQTLLKERDGALALAKTLQQNFQDLVACLEGERQIIVSPETHTDQDIGNAPSTAIRIDGLPTPQSPVSLGHITLPPIESMVGGSMNVPQTPDSMSRLSRSSAAHSMAYNGIADALPISSSHVAGTGSSEPFEAQHMETAENQTRTVSTVSTNLASLQSNLTNSGRSEPAYNPSTFEENLPIGPAQTWPVGAQPATPNLLELLPAGGCQNAQFNPISGSGTLQPTWSMVPLNSVDYDTQNGFCRWLAFPHAVEACPEMPRPEHLLFGSRSNFLADEIHRTLRKARVAEPERLAMGWLMYVFSKWRVSPTKERFERIPVFCKPTLRQLSEAHPAAFDMLLYPAIRHNLMSHLLEPNSHDTLTEFIAMLPCGLKVRWTWGEEILTLSHDDTGQIRDEFYKTFTSIEGWGITHEFSRRFPSMLEGLDINTVGYSVS